MTKIVEIWSYSLQIFSNPVANDYKSHVVVNGVVTFWLISTSEKRVITNFMGHDLAIIIMQIYFLISLYGINTNVIHLFVLFEHQCRVHCLDTNVICMFVLFRYICCCLFMLFTHESHSHNFYV